MDKKLDDFAIPWDEIPDFYDDEEAISFVLDFAQMDLTHLTRGEWLALEDGLRRFLGIHPSEAEQLRQYRITPESLAVIQAALAATLRTFIKARQKYIRSLPPEDPVAREVPLLPVVEAEEPVESVKLSREAAVTVEWGPWGVRPRVSSPHLRDHILFSLGLLLLRNDVDHLRECPVCGRLFYAIHGRQKFDSVQCKNKAAWEDFTTRQKQEEKDRQNQMVAKKRAKEHRKEVK